MINSSESVICLELTDQITSLLARGDQIKASLDVPLEKIADHLQTVEGLVERIARLKHEAINSSLEETLATEHIYWRTAVQDAKRGASYSYYISEDLCMVDREVGLLKLAQAHQANWFATERTIPALTEGRGMGKSFFGKRYISALGSLNLSSFDPTFKSCLTGAATIVIRLSDRGFSSIDEMNEVAVAALNRAIGFPEYNWGGKTFEEALVDLQTRWRRPLYIFFDDLGVEGSEFNPSKHSIAVFQELVSNIVQPLLKHTGIFVLVSTGRNYISSENACNFKHIYMSPLSPQGIEQIINQSDPTWFWNLPQKIRIHLEQVIPDFDSRKYADDLFRASDGAPRTISEVFLIKGGNIKRGCEHGMQIVQRDRILKATKDHPEIIKELFKAHLRSSAFRAWGNDLTSFQHGVNLTLPDYEKVAQDLWGVYSSNLTNTFILFPPPVVEVIERSIPDVGWYCETLTLVGSLAWVWDQPVLVKMLLKILVLPGVRLPDKIVAREDVAWDKYTPVVYGEDSQGHSVLHFRKPDAESPSWSVFTSRSLLNGRSSHELFRVPCDTAEQRKELFSTVSPDPKFLHSIEHLISRDM